MIDELLLGFVATLSLLALFKTRQYLNRLEEVAEGQEELKSELRKTRKALKKRKNDDISRVG